MNSDDYEKEAEEKLTAYEQKIANNYGGTVVRLSLKEHSLKEILDILKEEIEARL